MWGFLGASGQPLKDAECRTGMALGLIPKGSSYSHILHHIQTSVLGGNYPPSPHNWSDSVAWGRNASTQHRPPPHPMLRNGSFASMAPQNIPCLAHSCKPAGDLQPLALGEPIGSSPLYFSGTFPLPESLPAPFSSPLACLLCQATSHCQPLNCYCHHHSQSRTLGLLHE